MFNEKFHRTAIDLQTKLCVPFFCGKEQKAETRRCCLSVSESEDSIETNVQFDLLYLALYCFNLFFFQPHIVDLCIDLR